MKISSRQFTLYAAALGSSLAFIDSTAVLIALPTIQKSLHLGLNGEQWVFLGYSLALASLYLIGGAIGDRYGHRRVFLGGAIGFAVTSLLAGLSPTGSFLIVARVLQGVAGAFLTTNSLAWLRSVYGDQSGRAVGLWTSLTGIATIAAPPLGGAITQWISWRAIFLINLPLAALVWYLAKKGDADEPKAAATYRLDYGGAALIAIGFGFLTYGLVQGPKTGFAQLWWAFAIGIVALVSFVINESTTAHPMLPLNLFRERDFALANLQTFLLYGALNGILVYFTLYLQFLGMKPLIASLFNIPISIIMIALAAWFGAQADKRGARLFLVVGPILIGVGSVIFSLLKTQGEVWTVGLPGLLIFSVGLAMIVAPITAVALKSAPAAFSGIASGVNTTMSRVGGLIAVAIIGVAITLSFSSAAHSRNATPLDIKQKDPVLRQASEAGFRSGMYIVAGLALISAVTALGLSHRRIAKS